MFHYVYYSVTINETKEKFAIVFYCFSPIKIIAGPSFSSNFPVKLICCGIFVSLCLDKFIPMILKHF